MRFLTTKRAERIAKQKDALEDKNYWAIVKRDFYKNRLAVWSLRIFYVLLFIALMADFIANERPIYCQIKMSQPPVVLSNNNTLAIQQDTIQLSINKAPEATVVEETKENKVTKAGIGVVTAVTTIQRTSYALVSELTIDSLQTWIKTDSLLTATTVSEVDTMIETYFPVFRQYLVNFNLATWDQRFVSTKWLEQKYEYAIFPPITYCSTTRDARNGKFKSPFGEQKFEENDNRGWHYLGTERIGQDVAAGMIHGTRTAMLVGLVAMFIALIIGLFLGSLSGYFGDDRLQLSLVGMVLNVLAIITTFFYTFVTNGYVISDAIGSGSLLWAIGSFLFYLIIALSIANALAIPLKKVPGLGKLVRVPMDILIMRFIEIVNSIPLLILILAIVGIVENPSVLFVMVIIGAVSWTGIAKFVRAELLRVRHLEYIEAAQALGYKEVRIILRHALPNALAPVLIALAFGIASAILTEAFLSFIGVGIPDDQVTWGSLLRLSQDKFSAWWLAIFPGFAIFITVTIFNLIGEGLTDALDPRLRETDAEAELDSAPNAE
ncbi:MAG: ABC transporter permease [Aureispira sp.]